MAYACEAWAEPKTTLITIRVFFLVLKHTGLLIYSLKEAMIIARYIDRQ